MVIQALHQIRAVMRVREYGPGETDFGRSSQLTVNSPTCITLEYKGKIRPQPDREKRSSRASGGRNGTAVEPSLPVTH